MLAASTGCGRSKKYDEHDERMNGIRISLKSIERRKTFDLCREEFAEFFCI
jgi:hypothetical protein